MELEEVLRGIEGSREDMIAIMRDFIPIKALAPINGGDGEGKRADALQKHLVGYDSVIRIDVPDDFNPEIMRPNILARKNGKKPGTVWIVAHTDTVPVDDLKDWNTDPFEATIIGSRIYGRGTEDNGQAIVSSIFASKFIPKEDLNGMSIGIALVADEETTSKMGVDHLLKAGLFSKDDVFIVPDWGSPNGELIEISEKNLIWLQFNVIGKTAHGSTPDRGLNAFKVGSILMTRLMDELAKRFPERDPLYDPQYSTFEPTKSPGTVSNVNTIPGNFEVSFDMRMLPIHHPDDVKAFSEQICKDVEVETGATIMVTEVQRHASGRESSTESPTYKALMESIEEVTGVIPVPIGVGGATCANFFRREGYDSYVWEHGGGTLHGPNEYVEIGNIMIDAKVFATLFYKLCV